MPMEWASPAGLLNLAFVVNADGTIHGYQTKNQLALEEELQYVPGDVAPDGTCVGHTAHGAEALLVVDLDPGAATGSYARRYGE